MDEDLNQLLITIIEKAMKRFPKAEYSIVRNFLLESLRCNYDEQLRNLYQQAILYRWSNHTINAIRTGLNVMHINKLLK